jgi:hypothetical protein
LTLLVLEKTESCIKWSVLLRGSDLSVALGFEIEISFFLLKFYIVRAMVIAGISELRFLLAMLGI